MSTQRKPTIDSRGLTWMRLPSGELALPGVALVEIVCGHHLYRFDATYRLWCRAKEWWAEFDDEQSARAEAMRNPITDPPQCQFCRDDPWRCRICQPE